MAKRGSRAKNSLNQQEQNALEVNLEPQMLNCSYVVLVGAPGGHIQYDGNKLSRVFGSLGGGNVAQMPNGLAVIVGDSNQLIIQPPKILFKGANKNILFELYRNARREVLKHFVSQNASAFGVNFLYEVEFPGMSPGEALMRLLSDQVPKGMRLESAKLQKGESRMTLDISGRDPKRLLVVEFNNHIEKPELASFDNDTLRQEVEKYQQENQRTLIEIYQCLQQQHA